MSEVHERLNEKLNRARLAIEFRRSLRPLAVVGIGALLGLGCWLVIGYNVGRSSIVGHGKFTVEVNDATAVVAGRHEVRIHGLKVGIITAVGLKNGQARLTAQIESKYGTIYRDARATLRPNTALEDMFLDITDRGTPAAGALTAGGPALAADRTDTSVGISQVLQTFEPATREKFASLLDNLGGGLADHGDNLRQAFIAATPTLHQVGDLTHQVAIRSERTQRLMTNFNLLTGELAHRDAGLRRLVEDGGDTLKSIGENRGNLDATLRALPPTLQEVSDSLAAVRNVLPVTNTAVTSLRPVADALPSALKSVSSLSDDALPAVTQLQTPVRKLVPLSQALRPAAADASRAVTALSPQIPAVDHVTKSTAGCTLAIYGFMQWTSSLLKYNDGFGIFPRGDAVISLASPGGVVPADDETPARGCAPGVPKEAQP